MAPSFMLLCHLWLLISSFLSRMIVRIVVFMALPISLDECSKQPQPDHRLVTSLKPPNINENYKKFSKHYFHTSSM